MQDLVAGHSGVVGPALKKVRSDQAVVEAKKNDVEAMLKELRGVALANIKKAAGHVPERSPAWRAVAGAVRGAVIPRATVAGRAAPPHCYSAPTAICSCGLVHTHTVHAWCLLCLF